jgi:rhodanese-related sulfurtransferase
MFWQRPRSHVAEATPAEAHERIVSGEGILVDVREPHEWRSGHAAGARHIPLNELPRRAAELPKERPVYVICASGSRSRAAAELLHEAGFVCPINVNGGTGAWQRSALPMERGGT